MSNLPFRGILFDLDGTLVDSAPDLTGTLNDLRQRRGLPEIPHARLRSFATRGALGLLEAGFPDLDRSHREAMRDEFIERYRERLWQDSAPFPGMQRLLEQLTAEGLKLAIVTNKIESLAQPLVEQAGWHHLFMTCIAGDSTSRSKPDPLPIKAACEGLGLMPSECVMIGDDHRDIVAGKAAGTGTIAVSWGYAASVEEPEAWGSDYLADSIEQLRTLLLA